MNTSTHRLKNDKVTFAVVIGILLCSLIYTSGYILVVKKENEKFKHELRAIEEEMNLLFAFLPDQKQESAQKKQQILRQVEKIRKEFYQNNISSVSKQALLSQLSEVKTQVVDLEKQTKTDVAEESDQIASAATTPGEDAADTVAYPDNASAKPIKASIRSLPVRPAETIVAKKLSVYYFHVFSPDRKNRHQHTKQIALQLQLQGDARILTDPYLYVEIRDPNSEIITTSSDRIKAATDHIISYTFQPGPDYSFQKGRYVVRIFSADRTFKQIAFLILE